MLGKGKRLARRERFKATPSGYPGEGPVDIEQAYAELTHHGFSVWIRLMVVTDDELKKGRAALARLLKYSETRSNAVFRELRRKGYVTWITNPGLPSELVILRRCKLRGKSQFLRISRAFSADGDADVDFRNLYAHLTLPGKPHIILKEIPPLRFYPHRARVLPTSRSGFTHTALQLFTHTSESHHRPLDLVGADLCVLRAAFRQKQEFLHGVKRRKFVSENGYITRLAPANSASYKEKIANRVLLEKSRRERVRSEAKRSEGHGRRVTKIDFGKLDQRGDPAISFDPDSPLRKRMMSVLARPTRDPERKRLLAKLGTEFGRIYTRYRRQAESMYGLPASPFSYAIPDREKQHAAEAGMWCVIKGVTPRVLLEYWHTNIKTFASRTMRIPPLSLMRSPGMVDQAACSTLASEPTPRTEKKSKPKGDPRPTSRNSFSDEGALDKRLRRALERAGFDTQDYSDRYLMTVQQLATGIAKGNEVFVSSKQRPMVMWAAKNLYGGDG